MARRLSGPRRLLREWWISSGRRVTGTCKRLQAAKEVDHGSADLRRTLLLGPMTAARQHDRRPELGNHCRLLGNKLGIDGGDKIPVAGHVERGNGHRRSGKGSQQLPAAIDVAV